MNSETNALTSRILDTAKQYLQVFSTLDPSVLSPIQSETFIHSWAPKSVDPPAPLDKQGFAVHIVHLRDVLRSFPVRAKEIWPNPVLMQVVIWAESETVFHDCVKDTAVDDEWRYQGEYMFVLSLDESGGKINEVLEFLDSKGTERLRGLMARARRKKKEADGQGGGLGDEGLRMM